MNVFTSDAAATVAQIISNCWDAHTAVLAFSLLLSRDEAVDDGLVLGHWLMGRYAKVPRKLVPKRPWGALERTDSPPALIGVFWAVAKHRLLFDYIGTLNFSLSFYSVSLLYHDRQRRLPGAAL